MEPEFTLERELKLELELKLALELNLDLEMELELALARGPLAITWPATGDRGAGISVGVSGPADAIGVPVMTTVVRPPRIGTQGFD